MPNLTTERLSKTLFIHKRIADNGMLDPGFCVLDFDASQNEYMAGDYVLLCQHQLEVDVPAVDLTDKAIAALEAQAKKLRAETHRKLQEIDERIGNLRCLTFQPEDSPV